jgi:outer membrane PBP1 activator LpoA protein
MFNYLFIYLFIFLLSGCSTLNQEARSTVITSTNTSSIFNDDVKTEVNKPLNQQVLAKHKQIWQSLKTTPQDKLKQIKQIPEKDFSGWQALRILFKTSQRKHLLQGIKNWQIRFHNHPANQYIIPELITEAKHLPIKTKKIALLLPPPTNKFGILGKAIQNGFIAANYAHQTKFKISTHYVNSNNVSSIYKKVIKQGADFVIGPLLKTTIASLVENKVQLPIPVLALNHLDSQVNVGNLYQFALSAKDEAKAVAQLTKQHNRAIALYPNTDWGKGIFNTFSKEWKDGQIVKQIPYFYYNNYVTSISKSLTKNKNIDMIFLVAHSNKAYKIVPLLKRKFKDVTIYSTSHIYRGRLTPEKDYKLNNVIFIDMPWILTEDLPFSIKRHKRLYAFGVDTYLLLSKFLKPNNEREWQGKTGHLFVDNLGVIRRNQFITLQFVRGKPQLLKQ